ncbi:MAG: hypothetical protein NC340_00410 [Ruminococcus flavefaciens]|nr:hypothetical protein [Ruminococcus flavefaciens]MCM1228574.1 hypothetical protein [Ruminococcus flavefaciens]
MNIDDVKFFLENQLEAINNGSPEADTFLMMADYLLEQAEQSSGYYQSAGDREIRSLLRRCAKITRYAKKFADTYGTDVSSSAASAMLTINENYSRLEKLESDCNYIEEKAGEISRQADEIKEKNAELLAQEEQLRQRNADYMSLSARVAECREILQNVTDDVIESAEKELSEIENDAQSRKSQYNELDSQRRNARQELNGILAELEEIKSEIRQTEADNERFRNEKKRLDSDFEISTREAKRLAEAVKEAQEQADELIAVIEQNDRIAEAIRRNGFVVDDPNAPNNFYSYVESLRREANNTAENYNKLLADVIDDSTAMYKKIMERQEPVYK